MVPVVSNSPGNGIVNDGEEFMNYAGIGLL